eukprot:COSAG05_NODE_2731_length_2718_cov_1.743795_3_plen_72_part_00
MTIETSSFSRKSRERKTVVSHNVWVVDKGSVGRSSSGVEIRGKGCHDDDKKKSHFPFTLLLAILGGYGGLW